MANLYLSKTAVDIPIRPNDGYKIGIDSRAPSGVSCTGISYQDPDLTEGIPTSAVTNGWFTINAQAKLGRGDITFQYSDGHTETISVNVYDPSAPTINRVTFNVGKTVNEVLLVIER